MSEGDNFEKPKHTGRLRGFPECRHSAMKDIIPKGSVPDQQQFQSDPAS
jgi:hypothetical protein